MKARWFVTLVLVLVLSASAVVKASSMASSPLLHNIAAITAGNGHTCALTTGGGVKCWGYNSRGQLGNGTTTSSSTPVDVVGLASGVAAIAVGMDHSCALTLSGGVKCWGYNSSGQLGNGATTDSSTPVDVVGLASGVAAIAAGAGHTCALTTGGGVKCWGNNQSGQLGDGTTTQRNSPVDVVGLTSGMAAIAPGGFHSCALTAGGAVKCWGSNQYGGLGDGTTTNSSTPVDVTGLASEVIAVTTGWYHSCALMTGGGVKCWGENRLAQLGDNMWTNSSTPVDVVGLASGVSAIASKWVHTCAVTTDGAAKCWGYNQSGQVGDGTTTTWGTPVDVAGLESGVIDIATGPNHTCAAMAEGGVKCWGWNGYGQLGLGTTTHQTTPVDVIGLVSEVSAISAGGSHSCALTAEGGAKSWGRNGSFELGDGTGIHHSTPVDVVGLTSGVASVAAGAYHSCALTTGGGVKCWGSNSNGVLGDGTTTSKSTPVDVVGLASGVASVTAASIHSCVVTTGGAVKCWGSNRSGQLGDGTTNNSGTPVDVVGLASGVTAVAAGGSHTCALTTGGGVKCWGANWNGQLGDGTTNAKSTPVDVVGLASGVAAIAAGDDHTCAVSAGGGVKCWGANSFGQLGDGTTTSSNTPVDVIGLASGAAAIAAGTGHTCALTAGGGIQCWGDNQYGQLGDGTTTNRSVPVNVVGMASGVTAVDTGSYHSCALLGGGGVATASRQQFGGIKCWGSDSDGQLGLGTIAYQLTPADVVTPLRVYLPLILKAH